MTDTGWCLRQCFRKIGDDFVREKKNGVICWRNCSFGRLSFLSLFCWAGFLEATELDVSNIIISDGGLTSFDRYHLVTAVFIAI